MSDAGGYVMGLNSGHDSSVSILAPDGRVVSAVGEERLSRVKLHMGFPFLAVEEALRVAGIAKKDVGRVAIATKRLIFPGTPDFNALFFNRDPELVRANDYFNKPRLRSKARVFLDLVRANVTLARRRQSPSSVEPEAERLTLDRQAAALREIGLGHAAAATYEHHQCHAASAAYLSGKTDALVITIDGAGDSLCATASAFEGGRLRRLSKASDLVSPGRFYAEITGFLGYKRLRHEGKITGLAAYGDPARHYAQLRRFLRFDPATEQFVYDAPSVSRFRSKLSTVRRLVQDRPSSVPHVADFYDFLADNFERRQDARDLAAAAQRVLEEVAVDYVRHFLAKSPSASVLVAGGVFANVKVNQLVAEIPGIRFFYVHQHMGDGGIATGAALLDHHEGKGRPYDGFRPRDVYLGAGYTDAEILAELEARRVAHRRVEDIDARVAELVYQGRVVARFAGRMEYGPRALGNRSILAHTRDRSINDWLNKRLRRTEFMPFAPSVLGPRAGEIFIGYESGVCDYTDNFMTVTYAVRPEWHDRLQAATHVDGTARPQVVWPDANPSYYRVIDEYARRSGIPAVINTSFNMHEEPIVATPADALRAFEQGGLDYLAIGPFLCEYRQAP